MDRTIYSKKKVEPLLSFLFCFYLFFCFYEPYINDIIGGYGRYIVFIVIVCFFISYRYIKIEWYHFSIVLWFFLKSMSTLWVSFNYIVRSHFVSQVGMIALFLVMTLVKFDSIFISRIINVLLFSSASIGVLCLFYSRPYHGQIEIRQVLTIQGAQLDPNNQAAFLLIGVVISLYYIFNRKLSKLYFLLIVSVVIVNSYAMFLTGSRGGIVSLLSIVFIIICMNERSNKLISFKSIKNALFIFMVVVLVYYIAQKFLLQGTFERIFNFSSYSDGSNRVSIWGNTLEILEENPLFGGGWGAYWGYNDKYSAVHNTYLSVLSDGGLVGFILLFLPSIFVIYISIKSKHILPIIILLSGFMPSLFLDAINKRFFWNAIIIAFILINGYSQETEEAESSYKTKEEMN